MFTGIIKAVGMVKNLNSRKEGERLTIDTSGELNKRINSGDSLAVDGVCLTAETSSPAVEVAVSSETLKNTTLSSYDTGQSVNLEPALEAGKPLGGHLVSGHVDTAVEIKNIIARGDEYEFVIEMPANLGSFIVEKGSVALDGISLTVVECLDEQFTCRVIPHTFENTNLKNKKIGEQMNIEIDMMARYMENILSNKISSESELTKKKLKQAGFLFLE